MNNVIQQQSASESLKNSLSSTITISSGCMQYMLSFCIVIASAVIALSWSIKLEWNGME